MLWPTILVPTTLLLHVVVVCILQIEAAIWAVGALVALLWVPLRWPAVVGVAVRPILWVLVLVLVLVLHLLLLLSQRVLLLEALALVLGVLVLDECQPGTAYQKVVEEAHCSSGWVVAVG